jgi:hypothetical protein
VSNEILEAISNRLIKYAEKKNHFKSFLPAAAEDLIGVVRTVFVGALMGAGLTGATCEGVLGG